MPKPKFGGRTGHLYGEMLLTDTSRYDFKIAFNEREITLPKDMVQSPEGKWGTVVVVSQACFVDDGSKVDDATREKIVTEITAAFQKMDRYLKIE